MVGTNAVVDALILLILTANTSISAWSAREQVKDGGVKERLKNLEIENFGAPKGGGGQSAQLDEIEKTVDNIEQSLKRQSDERSYMRKKLGDAEDLSEVEKQDMVWDEDAGGWLHEYR